MRVFRPVLTNVLTQGFGESRACVDKLGKVSVKVNNVCPANSFNLYEKMGLKGHNGYDNRTWYREPVYHSAEFDGWMKTEVDMAGGIGVDIVSKAPLLQCTESNCDQTHYIKMRYWHGKEIKGFNSKEVKEGDLIMLADNTGLSSGDHLHWAIKWCDEKGNGLHKDNGYYGAFDQTPYYENEFVLIVKAIKIEAINAIHLARILIDAVVRYLRGFKVGAIGIKK